jgi:hypothetical protein
VGIVVNQTCVLQPLLHFLGHRRIKRARSITSFTDCGVILRVSIRIAANSVT